MYITAQALLKSKRKFSAEQSAKFYRSLTQKKLPKTCLFKEWGKGSNLNACNAVQYTGYYSISFSSLPMSLFFGDIMFSLEDVVV